MVRGFDGTFGGDGSAYDPDGGDGVTGASIQPTHHTVLNMCTLLFTNYTPVQLLQKGTFIIQG